jgi:hypothetical protein
MFMAQKDGWFQRAGVRLLGKRTAAFDDASRDLPAQVLVAEEFRNELSLLEAARGNLVANQEGQAELTPVPTQADPEDIFIPSPVVSPAQRPREKGS